MTILETVIAATLISVAVVASLRLSTNTQKEASYSRDLSLATKYNYQAIDWLKSVKTELGWGSFAGKIEDEGGSLFLCLSFVPEDSDAFIGLSSSSKDVCEGTVIPGTTSFYRTVEIVLTDSNTANILASTYWQGNIEHSVVTQTHLTNY